AGRAPPRLSRRTNAAAAGPEPAKPSADCTRSRPRRRAPTGRRQTPRPTADEKRQSSQRRADQKKRRMPVEAQQQQKPGRRHRRAQRPQAPVHRGQRAAMLSPRGPRADGIQRRQGDARSEEHTSELQSRENLVCRLLLEKKKYTR